MDLKCSKKYSINQKTRYHHNRFVFLSICDSTFTSRLIPFKTNGVAGARECAFEFRRPKMQEQRSLPFYSTGIQVV